jgi:hypothetical protein
MNILDLFGGDINKLMTASEIAMRRTEFSRSGIISHELDPSGTNLQYRNRATNILYDDISSAFIEASSMNITQFERITPGPGYVGDLTNNPRRAQMGIILQSMQDRFNQLKSGADAEFLDFLSRSGINEDDLSFNIIGSQSTRGKKSAEFLQSIESKIGGYIPFADDEGIDLLQLSVGGKTLSKKEMHLLMSHLGNDILNTSKLAKVFGAGGTSKDIEEYLAKIGKRVRGFMSDRDITFAAKDIVEYLGNQDMFGRLLTESDPDIASKVGVVVEEGLDIFKKHFDLQARGTVLRTKGGKSITHIGQIMENVDSQSIIESGIRAVSGKSIDEVMTNLNAGGFQDLVKNASSNKELDSLVKSNFGSGSEEYKIFKSIMDSAEKEFDGTAVLNKKLLEGAKNDLANKISRIENDIASGTGDTNRLRYELAQLKQQRQILTNASNLEQITGRGQVGEYGLKTAFEAIDMVSAHGRDFQGVAYIIGRSGLKEDLSFASGANMISLSGLGTPRDLVYADPVSVAFHPEVFASPSEIENIRAYQAQVTSDFTEAVEKNDLPKNIRNMLEKTVSEDFSSLPQSMQISRLRNQEYARQILQLHQSGVGPRESPQMMNMLHSLFASEAYTVRNKATAAGDITSLFMPVSPNTTRFAISSETASASMSGIEPILGNYTGSVEGRRGFSSIMFDLNGTRQTADLMKFRVQNHKMLLHAGAMKEYYNALGGFDLDDKGLPKLMTASYKDASGKTVRDLMFGLTRQPSASQEIIYGSATLDDVETLRYFFGKKNDNARTFLSTLENMKSGNDVMEDLFRVLNSYGKETLSRSEDEVKDAIIKVYSRLSSEGKASIAEADERTLQNIVRYGSAPLRYTDETTREGVYRIKQAELDDAVSSGLMSVEKKQNTFVRKELKKLLPEYQDDLDSALYDELLNVRTNQDLRDLVSRNTSGADMPVGLKSILSQSIFNFTEQIAKDEKDILGVYINRSMAVGSTLNQMEDFANMLDTADLNIFREIQIGLGTQEFAIDRATNFTAEKQFIAEISSSVVAAGSAGAAALRRFYKTDVGKVGEEAIFNMGQRLGAATSIYQNALATGKYAGSITDDMKPVIDQLILSGRLTESNDIPTLIRGIVEGIGSTGYTTDITDEILGRLSGLKEGGEKAVEYLVEQFGANGSHKYSSLAKMDEIGKKTAAELDALRRLSLAGIPSDQILGGTNISDEAQKIATYLLDSHKEEMDSILAKQSGELDETFKYINSLRKIAMGEQVAKDLKSASDMVGLTQEEILNAMEVVSARRGEAFRYAQLDTLSDEGLEFVRKLGVTRNRRTIDFYRKTMDSSRLGVLEEAGKILSDGTTDGARSLAEQINAGTILATDLTEAQSLAVAEHLGDDTAIGSEESRVVRALAESERLKAEEAAMIAELETRGAGTIAAGTADMGDDFTKGVSAALSGEDYTSFLGSNTTFKRMKDFVQSGELGDLFANNKIFRNSVLTAGALIAGSFLYSAFKDHTPDDVKGPPLLPGGSAYEDQYPNRLPEIPQIGTVNYNPGVSYKVNLYGEYDNVESFRSGAMGLGNFDMNTTMYNKIPDVGRDPYAEIASSY